MARSTTSTSVVTPLTNAGVDAAKGTDSTFDPSRGVFTLTNGTTYYIPLGGQDAAIVHATLQGDAAIVITSATIEECTLSPDLVDDYSDTAGDGWFATDANRIISAAEGTNWAATSDVGSSTGTNKGAVCWNITDNGARRLRIKLVIGATGGEVRCCVWGKE